MLGKDGKRGPAVLFLFLEAASVVLDFFERSWWASLAAFLLSAFGFAINIYVCYLEKTSAEIKPPAERQLGIVEIVFSVLQLIATLIHFILLASDVKYNYSASVVFPLAFSVIAIVFVFKEEEKLTNSSIAKDSSDDDSVLGTPIELDMRGTVMNHGNPKNKLRFRSRLFKEGRFFFFLLFLYTKQIYDFCWNLIIRLVAMQRAQVLSSFRLSVKLHLERNFLDVDIL